MLLIPTARSCDNAFSMLPVREAHRDSVLKVFIGVTFSLAHTKLSASQMGNRCQLNHMVYINNLGTVSEHCSLNGENPSKISRNPLTCKETSPRCLRPAM